METSRSSFSENKLRGIIHLLKESWQIYRSKIKILLEIMMLPVGFSLLSEALIYSASNTNLQYSIIFSLLETVSILGYFLISSWATISILYSIKDGAGLKESYRKGLKKLIPLIWISFLATIIILGGFLLLVIPGIIFSLWFSLAIFVLVFEEKQGMSAFLKSKHLISRKLREVLWRFLGFGFVVLVAPIVIFILLLSSLDIGRPETNYLGNILGEFLRLFITPLALIYGLLIYKNLEKIKEAVPYQEPTLRKKLKYLFPGILGSLVLAILIIFTFLPIFLGRDEPPPDDSDLRLPKMEIPREENAFYDFDQVLTKFAFPKPEEGKVYLPEGKRGIFDDIVEGKKWDVEFAKDLINNNKEALDHLEMAAKRSYFQDPALQDPESIVDYIAINSFDLKTLSKIGAIKAIYLLKQDKEGEAFDYSTNILKIGQLLEDSPRGPFLYYLMGSAQKRVGLNNLRTILRETTLPPEVLKSYAEELEQFKASRKGFVNMLKMEYIMAMNQKTKVDAAIAGKLSKEELKGLELEEIEGVPLKVSRLGYLDYLYKPNQTQRMYAEHFRGIINNVDKNCSQIELLETEPITASPRIKAIFIENFIGKEIFFITAIIYNSTRICEEDFFVSGTQLLMAIKAYQIENEKLPASLNELVPEYISAIPKDPFDGNTIRYLPEKKLIYSVGTDLKDSGGNEKGDLILKIEF